MIKMIIAMKSNASTHMYVHITQTQAHTQKRNSYDNDNDHLEVVRLLLERGANVEAVNNVSNRTCMFVLYVRTCVYLCLIS